MQQPIGWADGLQSMLARDAAGPAPTTRLPAIIYTSRTHSQLAQVIRELKRTSYRYAEHPWVMCCHCMSSCWTCLKALRALCRSTWFVVSIARGTRCK